MEQFCHLDQKYGFLEGKDGETAVVLLAEMDIIMDVRSDADEF